MITAPVASTDRMPMLAIIQKPERVSNILRSSTAITRDRGMGANAGRLLARSRVPVTLWVTVPSAVTGVRVVMPLLLLVGCRR